MTTRKLCGFAILALLADTAYVAAFPAASVFYMAMVMVHAGLGVLLAGLLLWLLMSDPALRRALPLPLLLGVPAALAGVYLAIVGSTQAHSAALWFHIGASVLASLSLLASWRRAEFVRGSFARALAVLLALAILVPAAARWQHRRADEASLRKVNSREAPVSFQGEGGGPNSPFYPSSARTNTGGIIPANFFMDSERCGECHRDIYLQWKRSVHHFASFNNQFYRKAIEYMQDVNGTQGSKLCAGCHDHAVFFNGRFDRPIREQIDTPEARNGLGCTSCHAITSLHSSMGNGDFTVSYPPLHNLASSRNPLIHSLDTYLTYLAPEPHRRVFLKPFMTTPEFCSACHKVHLDVPDNHYRWQRGFDDYDNWQASGVSGQGARSFYYPPKPMICADCHMPLVASADPANRNGFVHSHSFPAANTAVAFVNGDQAQLDEERKFLTSGFITVDLFAATPVEPGTGAGNMVRRTPEGPTLSSTMAVGEEAEQSGPVLIRKVGDVVAPLDAAGARFQPGTTVRIDAVVRTRTIGHFFPGGTVDSPDAWLEVQACDADGKVIFWSGQVQDGGRGPVEPGAHFYRSFLLDAHGNPINKRNAWQARSVLYVRLIPPGAADVAHYLVKIPANARGPITLTAKLNYRKFSWYFNRFAFAGRPIPGKPFGPAFDDRDYSFSPNNIPENVSGGIRGRIPDIPITVLATAHARLDVGARDEKTAWRPVIRKQDRERWNDWGIGLLLQGDLKGAEYAFQRVTEADPSYPDGWLNVARALVQEGETGAAKPYVARSLALSPNLARALFFQAMAQKADGDYDGAIASLRRAEASYPRDRVVLNQIGRLLFLKRDYNGAVQALNSVLEIDPEDLQAHYTLMLCYGGLKDAASAAREQKLFLRFKADEASQAITAQARMASPEDNNERQPVHDHESIPLSPPARNAAQGASRAGGK